MGFNSCADMGDGAARQPLRLVARALSCLGIICQRLERNRGQTQRAVCVISLSARALGGAELQAGRPRYDQIRGGSHGVEALFASGRIVDIILVLMLVEGVALGLIYRQRGRGIPLAQAALNLAAGASLMLVAREALTGATWPVMAASLMLALFAHVLDLVQRWK